MRFQFGKDTTICLTNLNHNPLDWDFWSQKTPIGQPTFAFEIEFEVTLKSSMACMRLEEKSFCGMEVEHSREWKHMVYWGGIKNRCFRRMNKSRELEEMSRLLGHWTNSESILDFHLSGELHLTRQIIQHTDDDFGCLTLSRALLLLLQHIWHSHSFSLLVEFSIVKPSMNSRLVAVYLLYFYIPR